MSNVLKENYKKLVDALAPYFGGASDFDDLTNRPAESDAIDIDDLDLPMPAKPTDYPILFDETGTEYKVGYYKRASDGKVKPVYRKDYVFNLASVSAGDTNLTTIDQSNIDIVKLEATSKFPFIITSGGGASTEFSVRITNGSVLTLHTQISHTNVIVITNLYFTKTTDEWKEV